MSRVSCGDCQGSGSVGLFDCQTCGGRGRVSTEARRVRAPRLRYVSAETEEARASVRAAATAAGASAVFAARGLDR